MKHFLLFTTLIAVAATGRGQSQEATITKPLQPVLKNEAGILMQTDFGGNSNNSFGMVGLQYNRWVTPQLGYRIIAAYGDYSSASGTHTVVPHPDTILIKQQYMRFNLPVVGFGVMAQRHFYKRVYLYASLELKGAYGNGHADTSVRSIYKQGQPGNSEGYDQITGNNDARLLMINTTAAIGARVQFSRLSLGAELTPVQIGYQQVRNNGRGGGTSEFELGHFSQRVFLLYRF